MTDPSRLVTVARFDRLHEAHLARMRLDDAGIPCTLTHEDMAGLPTAFDPEHGRAKLRVPADRADAARAVLDTTS